MSGITVENIAPHIMVVACKLIMHSIQITKRPVRKLRWHTRFFFHDVTRKIYHFFDHLLLPKMACNCWKLNWEGNKKTCTFFSFNSNSKDSKGKTICWNGLKWGQFLIHNALSRHNKQWHSQMLYLSLSLVMLIKRKNTGHTVMYAQV